MELLSREEMNRLSGVVLSASITVHREMGPGLLESVYHYCLLEELRERNVNAVCHVAIPLYYKSRPLGKDYLVDILVEDAIVVELKAVEALHPIHDAQLLSYLRLSKRRLGLLINFNVPVLKDGFRRLVNNF